jgi:protein TonB
MSTSALPITIALPAMNRNVTIVISVIALHVAVLWAVQTGLLRRVAEAVVPAEILVEIMAPAAPVASPQPMQQPQPTAQPKAAVAKPPQPTPPPKPAPAQAATAQPAPSPLAITPSATAPEPSAAAPTAVAAAPTAASANTGSNANAPTASTSPPAPSKVELPSSSADYLNNPKAPYPALSKRLGEQGSVVIRVWIGTDGLASQPSLKTSSGFDRLDRAALNAVLGWRYVPGKRGGVPEAMWFDVPVNWQLK